MKIKPKILIVDDDPLIQSMTKSALGRMQFHGRDLELIQALTAEEARKLYLAHTDIAVILLDVSMEYETAGLDFYQWVRERNHQEGIAPVEQIEQPIILRTSQTGNIGGGEGKQVKYPLSEYRQKMELANPKRLQNLLISNLITYHVRFDCAQLSPEEKRSGWEILQEIGRETGSFHFSEPLEKPFQERWPLDVKTAKILALSINTLRRLRAAAQDTVYDTETKPTLILVLETNGGLEFLSSFQRDHPRRSIIESEVRPIDLENQEALRQLGWDFQPWWGIETPQADHGDYTKWCLLRRIVGGS